MLKLRIVETLGEKSLLLPHYLDDALAANARAKYLFALLQAAQAHAEHPDRPPIDLRGERQAAQIDDTTLDGVVADSQRIEHGIYAVPQASRIHVDLFTALADMIRPLSVTVEDDRTSAFEVRLSALAASLPAPEDDRGATGMIVSQLVEVQPLPCEKGKCRRRQGCPKKLLVATQQGSTVTESQCGI